jgi:hypothetical protein
MRWSFASLEDDGEKQATATADSLREWKKEKQKQAARHAVAGRFVLGVT